MLSYTKINHNIKTVIFVFPAAQTREKIGHLTPKEMNRALCWKEEEKEITTYWK